MQHIQLGCVYMCAVYLWAHLSVWVCLWVCVVYVCVYVGACTHVYVEARGQCWVSSSVVLHLVFLFSCVQESCFIDDISKWH